MHKLTVELLIQSLDLPLLLEQADGVVVHVGGRLVGAIDSDTCKWAGQDWNTFFSNEIFYFFLKALKRLRRRIIWCDPGLNTLVRYVWVAMGVCVCVCQCVCIGAMKGALSCAISSCSNRMNKHKVCVWALLHVHVAGCWSVREVAGVFSAIIVSPTRNAPTSWLHFVF